MVQTGKRERKSEGEKNRRGEQCAAIGVFSWKIKSTYIAERRMWPGEGRGDQEKNNLLAKGARKSGAQVEGRKQREKIYWRQSYFEDVRGIV